MARAALRWSAADLASKAGVGYATVARYEAGGVAADSTVKALATALEAGGVEFIPGGSKATPGGTATGPGIRLRA